MDIEWYCNTNLMLKILQKSNNSGLNFVCDLVGSKWRWWSINRITSGLDKGQRIVPLFVANKDSMLAKKENNASDGGENEHPVVILFTKLRITELSLYVMIWIAKVIWRKWNHCYIFTHCDKCQTTTDKTKNKMLQKFPKRLGKYFFCLLLTRAHQLNQVDLTQNSYIFARYIYDFTDWVWYEGYWHIDTVKFYALCRIPLCRCINHLNFIEKAGCITQKRTMVICQNINEFFMVNLSLPLPACSWTCTTVLHGCA